MEMTTRCKIKSIQQKTCIQYEYKWNSCIARVITGSDCCKLTNCNLAKLKLTLFTTILRSKVNCTANTDCAARRKFGLDFACSPADAFAREVMRSAWWVSEKKVYCVVNQCNQQCFRSHLTSSNLHRGSVFKWLVNKDKPTLHNACVLCLLWAYLGSSWWGVPGCTSAERRTKMHQGYLGLISKLSKGHQSRNCSNSG